MTKNQIEHVKTGVLAFLVFTSFLFSAYLWYSTPASEVLRPDNDVPPYIFKNPLYSNRERHELIAPFQMIVHQGHRNSLLLPDETNHYKNIEKMAHQLDISQFKEIYPSKQEWVAMAKGVGVELLFLHDSPYELVEAFWDNAIPYLRTAKPLNTISRVWIFRDSSKVRVWLISEREQRVAEAITSYPVEQFEKQITSLQDAHLIPVSAISLSNSLPWEGSNVSFSRIFHLPTNPITIKPLTFSVENINIDNMKQWLFGDPDIKPLVPNSDESFYMYNDQLLNYNTKRNNMTYNDSSSVQDSEVQSFSNQLDQMKNFMQRHQGWTGLYLLDESQKNDLYLFRLFKQGYPVFWPPLKEAGSIQPDLIELQTGSNGVNKYMRSMYFLAGKPVEGKEVQLPGREALLAALREKKISFSSIERIFPGYMAEEKIVNKRKQVQLNPVWVVCRVDGKKEFVG